MLLRLFDDLYQASQPPQGFSCGCACSCLFKLLCLPFAGLSLHYRFSRWAKWPTVRNTAANIAANRAAAEARAVKERQKSQAKRPAAAAAADESPPVAAGAADNSEGGEPASKQQRLERPGRLQGATAAMVVASQVSVHSTPWLLA